MDSKKAKSLLDYVQSNQPVYGPSDNEAGGSGPGGAAAGTMKAASMDNKISKVFGRSSGGVSANANALGKMSRSVSQMRAVANIYNDARKSLPKKSSDGYDI